jgi:hypothetical protein
MVNIKNISTTTKEKINEKIKFLQDSIYCNTFLILLEKRVNEIKEILDSDNELTPTEKETLKESFSGMSKGIFNDKKELGHNNYQEYF